MMLSLSGGRRRGAGTTICAGDVLVAQRFGLQNGAGFKSAVLSIQCTSHTKTSS